MNSKAIKRQLLAAIAMVLVAAIALGSSTYAWFVSNTKVTATSSSVKATSATPNLLIVEGGSVGTPLNKGGKTAASIASTKETALYPASTDDCLNWWVVSGWEANGTTQLANAYYKPTINSTDSGSNVKSGQYTQGSLKLNAYQVSTYSVYTANGDVDLCLDPENPISVSVKTTGTNHPTGSGFMKALRVGIVVDGTLKLVYAPQTETAASGNDKDSNTNSATTVWRTVNDASSTKDATYPVVSGNTFTDWGATDNHDGTYTKPTNTLGKVTSTGSVVQIYVWLEGTDTDCVVGTADVDSDDNVYQVTLKFVGSPA